MDGITLQGVFFCSNGFRLCPQSMLYLSKQAAAKTKLSKSAGERGLRTPRLSQAPAILVKTEPVDTDEGLRNHLRLSSPIVISSSENEEPTPKARPSKGKNYPSSLKKLDFSHLSKKNSSLVKLAPQPVPQPTPRQKGKEPKTAADTEDPVVDQPGSNQLEPLSETTVYLEDM
jgi:hypothetical protein